MLTVTEFNKLRTNTTFDALLRYNVLVLAQRLILSFSVRNMRYYPQLLEQKAQRKLGTVNHGLAPWSADMPKP